MLGTLSVASRFRESIRGSDGTHCPVFLCPLFAPFSALGRPGSSGYLDKSSGPISPDPKERVPPPEGLDCVR